MAAFPSFTPTSRSFTPGTYPQRSYRSLSGVVTKRTFGNAPSQSALEMNFDNVADSTATAIINHYRSQTAINKRFQLSTITMGGMDSGLVNIADGTIDNLRFEYKEPPSVQSVRPGRSSVSVSLIGEIRDPRSDD
jgi:hypothetical protein